MSDFVSGTIFHMLSRCIGQLYTIRGLLSDILSMVLKCLIYTQLQKKPISPFSGLLWKSELRNENIFIPYFVAISSASFH